MAGAVAAGLALAADEPVLRAANACAAAVAGLAIAGGVLLRLPALVPVAIALCGAEYAAVVGFEGESLDGRAPLVAASLLVTAELAYWSLELRDAVADEAGSYLRRVALLAALALGALALGALLLAAVDLAGRGGLGIEALGVAAAVAALALVALAARRTEP